MSTLCLIITRDIISYCYTRKGYFRGLGEGRRVSPNLEEKTPFVGSRQREEKNSETRNRCREKFLLL